MCFLSELTAGQIVPRPLKSTVSTLNVTKQTNYISTKNALIHNFFLKAKKFRRTCSVWDCATLNIGRINTIWLLLKNELMQSAYIP